MKAKNDRHTIELPMPGAKGVPGRPRKLDALSDAERAKRYRDKRRGQPTAVQAEVTRLWERIENLEQRIEAKDCEISCLVRERAAAWRVIERLKAELAHVQSHAEG